MKEDKIWIFENVSISAYNISSGHIECSNGTMVVERISHASSLSQIKFSLSCLNHKWSSIVRVKDLWSLTMAMQDGAHRVGGICESSQKSYDNGEIMVFSIWNVDSNEEDAYFVGIDYDNISLQGADAYNWSIQIDSKTFHPFKEMLADINEYKTGFRRAYL